MAASCSTPLTGSYHVGKINPIVVKTDKYVLRSGHFQTKKKIIKCCAISPLLFQSSAVPEKL